jgi:hypothetical protein
MDKKFEKDLINVLNNWHINLTPVSESDIQKYKYSKNKFRNLYLVKTGQFLKITQLCETVCFNRICDQLSKNYFFTEDLLNEYLEWCFTNYDFFLRKYNQFTLNDVVKFSGQWSRDFLDFEFESKTIYEDLANINVQSGIFLAFETYGIPFAATKLAEEKSTSGSVLCPKVMTKLKELTTSADNLSRLKNMLRVTVENGPYSSEILFNDYKNSLSEFFLYFKNEPWCP